MKITYIILFCLINVVLTNAQSAFNSKKYFINTIKMIDKYSSKNGEYMGIEADSINKRVYRIIYLVNDSCIKREEKFDILVMMIFYQRYSSDLYRTRVLNNKTNIDSITNDEILYMLPFIFCNQCNNEMVLTIQKYDKEKLITYVKSLPEPYHKYFISLIDYTYSKNNTFQSDFFVKKTIERYFFSNDFLKNKYKLR